MRGPFRCRRCGLFLVIVALAPARAADRFTLRLEPWLAVADGHDQHVATIHEREAGPPAVDRQTLVTLDSDRKLAPGLELRYERERWGGGLRFFLYGVTNDPIHVRAAAGGSVDEVGLEIPSREFVSGSPDEVVFYDLLEDNRLEAWTFDLYATRMLTPADGAGLRLQLGLRLGDFDNDYRAVAGVEGVGGTRLDSSSNYPAMAGPLVGLIGTTRAGAHEFRGYIGQSLLFAEASLSAQSRDFTGAFGGEAFNDFDTDTSFNTSQDAAVPVTELRGDWTWGLGRHIGIGLGAAVSAWFDVPVPPGAVPNAPALQENTVVFTAATLALEWRF